jgi:hypothetical protein
VERQETADAVARGLLEVKGAPALRARMRERGIDLKTFARETGEHYTNVSAVLNGGQTYFGEKRRVRFVRAIVRLGLHQPTPTPDTGNEQPDTTREPTGERPRETVAPRVYRLR